MAMNSYSALENVKCDIKSLRLLLVLSGDETVIIRIWDDSVTN